jgi:hypothetical protein
MGRLMLIAAVVVIAFAAASRASWDDQLPAVTTNAPNVWPMAEVKRIVDSDMTDLEKARALTRFVWIGQSADVLQAKLIKPPAVIYGNPCPVKEDQKYYWNTCHLVVSVKANRITSIGYYALANNGICRCYRELAR